MESIKKSIEDICKKLFSAEIEVELSRPDEQFGDYATNVALKLAKQLNKNPRAAAEVIVAGLKHKDIASAEVAGPGFINLRLSDSALEQLTLKGPSQTLDGKIVVAEYSDPNPFKVLHAGHVYTTVIGDAIARLLEVAGAKVHRVNYGGDIGLHVGKTMWAILREVGGEYPEKLANIPDKERSNWLSARYIEGNNAYENEETTKTEIISLNKRVYQIHAANDHDSALAQIYWTCRQWSYDAFDTFYKRLGTKMERYYPESEVAELGLRAVREQIGKVFEEGDSAVVFKNFKKVAELPPPIVFKGEPYGLHTRVFINSQGLPTYEAKEIGLIIKKYKDYSFDQSVVITGNEQQEYMAVMLKAIEQFLPDLAKASKYVPHGMVKLAGGLKMSSRKGNIIAADEVLNVTAKANKKLHGKDDETAVLAAVKYAFLKNRIGGDIIYSPEESVSLLGNSGPYLQYAHARARSILAKSSKISALAKIKLEPAERSLLRKIGQYSEVVDQAIQDLSPSHITTYLYELAQSFNSFYEHNRVIGDEREALRLKLVQIYADVLKNGLEILNIPAPDRM